MAVSPDHAYLPQLAPLQRELAEAQCAPGCRAYHAVWGFLRLYGTLPSVARDDAGLRRLLAVEAAMGRRSVLVSGAADPGLLSYVLAAFADTTEVCVTDLCPTPLASCHWYAAQLGRTISTASGDIRALDRGGFDLVLAHNFLNFFDANAREQVAARWRASMVPGGRVLVFANIRPGSAPVARRFDAAATEALVADALRDRAASAHADLITAEDLAALVRDFAERRVSNRLRSEEELCAPLEAAGLRVLAIEPLNETDREFGGGKGRRVCLVGEAP